MLGDRVVKAGERVVLTFPAANRDPAVFEHPEEVVIDRERNRHIALGSGIHRCAGSNLARMEMTVAVTEFLAMVPDFELEDPTAVTWAGGQVPRPPEPAGPVRLTRVSFQRRSPRWPGRDETRETHPVADLQRDDEIYLLRLGDGENRFDRTSIDALDAALDEVDGADGPRALRHDRHGQVLLERARSRLPGIGCRAGGDVPARCDDPLGPGPGLHGSDRCGDQRRHAFAGGAMFALAADRGLMHVDRGYWCINEIQLGMVLAPGVRELIQCLPSSSPATASPSPPGIASPAPEALAAGIVDETATSDQLLEQAIGLAATLAPTAGPTSARKPCTQVRWRPFARARGRRAAEAGQRARSGSVWTARVRSVNTLSPEDPPRANKRPCCQFDSPSRGGRGRVLSVDPPGEPIADERRVDRRSKRSVLGGRRRTPKPRTGATERFQNANRVRDRLDDHNVTSGESSHSHSTPDVSGLVVGRACGSRPPSARVTGTLRRTHRSVRGDSRALGQHGAR